MSGIVPKLSASRLKSLAMPTPMNDYSAACWSFLVPGGEALWLASSSCSVIGRVMGHGELVEVSVTGAQEAVAAVADMVSLLVSLKLSIATARHCAIAV